MVRTDDPSVAEASLQMQRDLSTRPTRHCPLDQLDIDIGQVNEFVVFNDLAARDDREFSIFARVANTSDAKTAYFK